MPSTLRCTAPPGNRARPSVPYFCRSPPLPLTLLVDARLLHGGGIGRYLREVLGQWHRDARVGEIRLLGDPAELAQWICSLPPSDGHAAALTPIAWTDPLWSLQAQLRWLHCGRRWTSGCDAVLFPHWSAPGFRHVGEPRRAVVVHDLIQFLEPDAATPLERAAGRVLLRAATDAAHVVLTVSHASAADLERELPGVGRRLHVVPNGVSDVFRASPPADLTPLETGWCARLGLRAIPPFVLAVGALRPHKNLLRAVEAAASAGLELWMVGPERIEDPALADRLRTAAHVRRLGPLPDELLRELLLLTLALVHPAHREGFALPVAEALALGTPVVASDRTAIRETVALADPGAPVILLDPDDGPAWAHALARIAAGGLPPGRTPGFGSWRQSAERILGLLT